MSDSHLYEPDSCEPRRSLRRALTLVLLAGVVLAVAGGAIAEPPHRGEHPGRLAGLVADLGLDAATQELVGEVLAESHERRRAMRPQLREAHQRMRGLMEADQPDEAAIFAQLEELAGLELESKKNRIRTLLRVRELLPPDARTKLVEQMQRGREGRRGPRRHEHHDDPRDDG